MNARFEIRPVGPWLDPITDPRAGAHRFKADWSTTLDMLEYEVGLLGGYLIVVQVDVTDGELRRDGMLRAGAKVGFPGVRVSFDSMHGPLTYATDAYERQYGDRRLGSALGGLDGWQANVRAIALALEALRAVDRYGVTRRGEQYQGWTAIAAQPATMTREQAAEFIAHWAAAELSGLTGQLLLTQPAVLKSAYRAAARRAHPDVAGGDADTMARLTAARDLLLNGAVP